MIYKLMPSVRIAWRDVWVGATVTAVMFEVGKLLIGLYIGKSGVTESFAAAGSLVVLLAWVYYAAQIFLLGAEFTKVYATENAGAAVGSDATGEKTDLTAVNAAQAGQQPQERAEPADLADKKKALADTDNYLDKETNRVLNRFLMLVAMSVAELAMARWYQRKRKAHEQLRRRNHR